MAGDRNPESAINAIISELGDNLAGYMTTIDGEWSDTITLEDIADYYRGPLRSYPRYPAAVVVAVNTEHPATWRSYRMQRTVLMIEVIIRSRENLSYQSRDIGPSEVANIKIKRTCDSILRTIQANDQLTRSGVDYVDIINVTDIEYSETIGIPGNADLFEKRGVISLEALADPLT